MQPGGPGSLPSGPVGNGSHDVSVLKIPTHLEAPLLELMPLHPCLHKDVSGENMPWGSPFKSNLQGKCYGLSALNEHDVIWKILKNKTTSVWKERWRKASIRKHPMMKLN